MTPSSGGASIPSPADSGLLSLLERLRAQGTSSTAQALEVAVPALLELSGAASAAVARIDHEEVTVITEAGATLGWERYTMANGLQIGLDRFGASAPAEDLFARFGFTAEAIVPRIKDKLGI